MKRVALAAALLAALALVISCRGPVGPAGKDGVAGAQGIPGPSLYLADAAGVRYYSGSAIGLGLIDGSWNNPPTLPVLVSKQLSLVNKTSGTISFTASDQSKKVKFVDGYYLSSYMDGSSYTVNDSDIPEITVSSQPATATTSLPAGGSVDLTLALTRRSNSYRGGEFRKNYKIEIQDADGSADDFVFEVYGVASC